ncbi:hypothetical protein chiPu_0028263, partial [Chiloscyllium punctatum]|nr:hypothetical protein [Chiloscyllium punctatum]
MVKLKWESSSSIWSSIMGRVTNPFSVLMFWDSAKETSDQLEIRKIRVKAGETQKR